MQDNLWLEQQTSQAQQLDVERQLLTAQKKAESRLDSLKREYHWLEHETLPRLETERGIAGLLIVPNHKHGH